MQTQEAIKLLDEVLSGLDKAAQGTAGETALQKTTSVVANETAPLADAIDREIGGTPRQTNIVRLLDSTAAEQFRRELETESLTVTTVTSVLQLVRQALQIFGIVAA